MRSFGIAVAAFAVLLLAAPLASAQCEATQDCSGCTQGAPSCHFCKLQDGLKVGRCGGDPCTATNLEVADDAACAAGIKGIVGDATAGDCGAKYKKCALNGTPSSLVCAKPNTDADDCSAMGLVDYTPVTCTAHTDCGSCSGECKMCGVKDKAGSCVESAATCTDINSGFGELANAEACGKLLATVEQSDDLSGCTDKKCKAKSADNQKYCVKFTDTSKTCGDIDLDEEGTTGSCNEDLNCGSCEGGCNFCGSELLKLGTCGSNCSTMKIGSETLDKVEPEHCAGYNTVNLVDEDACQKNKCKTKTDKIFVCSVEKCADAGLDDQTTSATCSYETECGACLTAGCSFCGIESLKLGVCGKISETCDSIIFDGGKLQSVDSEAKCTGFNNVDPSKDESSCTASKCYTTDGKFVCSVKACDQVGLSADEPTDLPTTSTTAASTDGAVAIGGSLLCVAAIAVALSA